MHVYSVSLYIYASMRVGIPLMPKHKNVYTSYGELRTMHGDSVFSRIKAQAATNVDPEVSHSLGSNLLLAMFINFSLFRAEVVGFDEDSNLEICFRMRL